MIRSPTLFLSCNSLSLSFAEGAQTRYQAVVFLHFSPSSKLPTLSLSLSLYWKLKKKKFFFSFVWTSFAFVDKSYSQPHLFSCGASSIKLKVSASKVLQETCNYIRSLHREVDDLSDRVSQLLASMDTDSDQAAIIRSLLMQ
ncbi:uncharacterized protein LOC111288056 isoform X1 [Durio zibethinus]|uniref:Uncharacterized protein LOC111288056 isoform X1 n=1 Tax=Durio zibethinus TaxID=66656 RepID=A0A6P5Y294_DURZI|nr:uncharacterized protein LOC111288056 isoform X1 [Durio zibethinus]